MKLNRRDALVALTGLGLTGLTWMSESNPENISLNDRDFRALIKLSEVLYPSEVSASVDFVRTYVVGQDKLNPDHSTGIKRSLQIIRRHAMRYTGSNLTALATERNSEVLRSTGADRAHPDPNGTNVQQIRYYIINNLLYALYTTPKGGSLVGNPNPPGYPGGLSAYQVQ